MQPRDAYLESEVLTATPQRLRLMLIEGTQRFARQTLQHWEQGDLNAGHAALDRARSVVAELMSSIQPDGSALSRKVAEIYLFLYRSLAEAALDHDAQRVREAIEILAIERETWRLVCEQNPQRVSGGDAGGAAYRAAAGPLVDEGLPYRLGDSFAAGRASGDASVGGGLTLEA